MSPANDKGIDFVVDSYEIILFFESIKNEKSRFWLWQIDQKNSRIIHYGRLKFLDKAKKTGTMISVLSNKEKPFNFDLKQDVFFYHDLRLVAGKMKIRTWTVDGGFIFDLPERLNVLTKDSIALLELEAEEKYRHLRKSPRKKTSGTRFASIRRFSDNSNSPTSEAMYMLYDLSAGGMSFWVDDPGEFRKGDGIEFFAMDGNSLADVLKGNVVAIRTVENEERVKVCVKFV